jgi:capsular exopolysaccharide synthesis family protein
LESFDRRLRHPVVEAEYGLPLLASIPFSRKAHAATRSGARVPVAIMEGVRGVRTMLDHGAGSNGAPRSVLITSAVSGEGKSTLIKSLALGYFESARSVLVIDADLRRPMIHELFDAPLVPGLSDVLRGAIPLSDAVQQVQPGNLEPAIGAHDAPVLHVLTSGAGISDPGALLGSENFSSLLATAVAEYDIVLIDSTPILAVSDAIPMATQVDAVVVVARSDYTTRDAAQRCRQALERLEHVNVVGVVANAVREDTKLGRPYYVASSA